MSRIHGIFQATISSLLTVNSYELPADQYFRLIRVIAPLRFGFIEGGSIALWNRMAGLIRDYGGVWTGTPVEAIHVTRGRVSGVRIRKDREYVDVGTSVVVSNTGQPLRYVCSLTIVWTRSMLRASNGT